MKWLCLPAAGVLFCVAAGFAQTPGPIDESALNGVYHFVQLEVSTEGAAVNRVRSASGQLTFDGAGSFTLAGEAAEGGGPFVAFGGQGSYAVDAMGNVRLTNLLTEPLEVQARLSAGSVVVVGTTLQAPGELKDIFVAVRAGEELTDAVLDGDYAAAALGFPGDNPSQFHCSLIEFSSAGTGEVAGLTLTGRRVGGGNEEQTATGVSYEIGPNGAGTASFGQDATLLQGEHKIFADSDGGFVIGLSTGPTRSILIATQKHAGGNESFAGRYWIAELSFLEGLFSAGSGAIVPDGRVGVLVSERFHFSNATFDLSGLNFFDITREDGVGWMSNRVLNSPAENMALGATGSDGLAGSAVGVQLGPPGLEAEGFGLFVAVRAPEFDLSQFVLHPAGVVNGASFSPSPNPIAPGSIVSLFGQSFTASPLPGVAEGLPLPAELQGLQVTINGTPARFFFTSSGQVNIQAPFGLEGDTAAIVPRRGGLDLARVEVPLAPTSPGVFFYASGQSAFRGVVTHPDGSLVSEESPAAPGEVVVIYATGLGDLTPAVPTGAEVPASPLLETVHPVEVFVNRVPAEVLFAGGAPGFAGLYQVNARIAPGTPAPGLAALALGTPHAFHDQVDLPLSAATAAKAPAVPAGKVRAKHIPPRARQ